MDRIKSVQVNRPWWVRLRIWWHEARGHSVMAEYYVQLRRYVVRCHSCGISLDFAEKSDG